MRSNGALRLSSPDVPARELEDELEVAVLTTIAYFDVHACAPAAREVHRFLVGRAASLEAVEGALERLRARGAVETSAGLWSFGGKLHLVPRRIRFLEHSRRLWPEAKKIANIIERTGLATAGFITGSLAADNADEHADIDFLFTYPPERTWTSFALVRLTAKLPGLTRCCANYAMPENNLAILPQNLFTAWELAKAVPMFGFDVHERLLLANSWVTSYLPNAFPSRPVNLPARTDPDWVRTLTHSKLFQSVERVEKSRKFDRERRDVGVDMSTREREGRSDRHSPVRSSFVLSELHFRMSTLGLSRHPIFPELREACTQLTLELTEWAGDPIPAP
ncbi:MAG: hypothetical protein HY791_17510 [Deltaproteobacteria bacterium]|nr:hypothetical protein [Deltaproteobacteria bacterium]